MENILDNIEAIRKEKRIKQEVIAAELGIKQSSYSSYITRESDITFSRLSHIGNILGVSVVDIITYPERYVLESSVKQCLCHSLPNRRQACGENRHRLLERDKDG